MAGDLNVGKTTMLYRYSNYEFLENSFSMIGVDFKMVTQEIDGKSIKLQIWEMVRKNSVFRVVIIRGHMVFYWFMILLIKTLFKILKRNGVVKLINLQKKM
jgi:hypothetical protein